MFTIYRLLEVTCFYRDELDKIGVIGQFHTTYAKLKYGPGEENVYNASFFVGNHM